MTSSGPLVDQLAAQLILLPMLGMMLLTLVVYFVSALVFWFMLLRVLWQVASG